MASRADLRTPPSWSLRRGSSRSIHVGFCDSPKATAAGDAQIGQLVREERRHSLTTIGLESRKAESRLAHHLPS